MSNKDADAFFALLAGKTVADASPEDRELAARARAELLAREAWSQAFQAQPDAAAQTSDAASDARLLAELKARNLFSSAPASALGRRADVAPSLATLLRTLLLGDSGWMRPAALAATLVVAVVLVIRPGSESDAWDTPRSGSSPAQVPLVVRADAEQLQQRLVSEFETAGALAVAVMIKSQPPTWRIAVEVPPSADSHRLRVTLESAGIKVEPTERFEFDLATLR